MFDNMFSICSAGLEGRTPGRKFVNPNARRKREEREKRRREEDKRQKPGTAARQSRAAHAPRPRRLTEATCWGPPGPSAQPQRPIAPRDLVTPMTTADWVLTLGVPISACHGHQGVRYIGGASAPCMAVRLTRVLSPPPRTEEGAGEDSRAPWEAVPAVACGRAGDARPHLDPTSSAASSSRWSREAT